MVCAPKFVFRFLHKNPRVLNAGPRAKGQPTQLRPVILACSVPFLNLRNLGMGLFQRLIQRRPIIQQNPFNDRQWQTPVFDQIVVILTKTEVRPLLVTIPPK